MEILVLLGVLFALVLGFIFGRFSKPSEVFKPKVGKDGKYLSNREISQIKNLLSPVTNLAEMQLDHSFDERERFMDDEAMVVKGAVREIVKIIKYDK